VLSVLVFVVSVALSVLKFLIFFGFGILVDAIINIGTCAFFGVGCFRFDSSSIIGVLRRTCHGLSLGQRPFVRVVCLFDGNAGLFVQLHLEVLEEHLCFGSSANCVRLVV